jgi:outer membrane beta-barrel protein
MRILIIAASVVFVSLSAWAETIEFPEEELATESVLPVFDKKVVVRERAIKTAGHFEVGGGMGLNLVEPLYSQNVFSLTASYHLTELHGINVYALFLSDELSGAGADLKAGKGLTGGNKFDASRAPTIDNMFFANYQFTAYYGKISITKQNTMNLSLYGTAGLGMVNWTDSSDVGLDFGIGQKLYFTENLGLRFDLMMAVYQGPDPTASKGVNHALPPTDPKQSSDYFDTTIYFRPFLTGAFVFLF